MRGRDILDDVHHAAPVVAVLGRNIGDVAQVQAGAVVRRLPALSDELVSTAAESRESRAKSLYDPFSEDLAGHHLPDRIAAGRAIQLHGCGIEADHTDLPGQFTGEFRVAQQVRAEIVEIPLPERVDVGLERGPVFPAHGHGNVFEDPVAVERHAGPLALLPRRGVRVV